MDSIQLVTRKPLDEIASVALTRQSATSVALLKTILKLRFGQEVAYGELEGSVPEALEEYDAVLLIGDQGLEALYFPQPRTTCHDLGALWQEWTGLPMVYAVWAAREDFARTNGSELLAVEEELVECMDYGREHLSEVVDSALGRFRFDRAGLTRYFAVLRYDFTAEYRRGLRRFYELAHEAGELAEVPELRFIDEVAEPARRTPTVPAGPASAPPAGAGQAVAIMTRLSDGEALELLRSRDLLEVGARAHEVRERLVPGPLATFIIDRNINYTNVCVSGCRFCAFHCAPGSAGGLRAPPGGHPRQDPGDPGPRRHGGHDAGRAAPRPRHHLFRGAVPLDQGATSPSPSTRSRLRRSSTSPRSADCRCARYCAG